MPATKQGTSAEDAMLVPRTEDWQIFVKSLDSVDIPKPKLAAAMRKYREWRSANSGDKNVAG
ncbi:hypothetical protein SAMN05216319_4364 [Duganella sp. CF402]|uniref:hypothetical protein n=1 Tax=unclassified Duganella TaxID=2636909 RepID=UPI0008D6D0AF|nr:MULTISPECIES: hypothetical protein [unclassified Duganella]RZT03858.1 hypothetical protein EV582_4739 [Duganella sp. BK701]SEM57151.1 hypothetical protein SAMN05216319_4364 [Duganella sp. CF402]